MYSIVKRLYDSGVERTRAEISEDQGHTGELIFGHVGLVPTATLTELEDESMRPIIPPLEHAQLVVMRVDLMKFRGIERKKGVAYLQEWSVQIIGYGL